MLIKRCVLCVLALLASACAQIPLQPAAAPPTFRLGDGAAPLRYAARLAIDPARDDFSGEIRIDLRIKQATAIVWLNAIDISVSAARIQYGSSNNIPLQTIAGGSDFIGLQAAQALPAGDATVTLQYRGKLEALSTYGLFKQQSGGDWYVISQFESYDARRAFPCFDEPGWKVPWQITLDVPAELVAVSNTPQLSEAQLPNNWKRITFAPTPPLPAYLIAMAVGPFDVVDGGTAGSKKIPLRYLAPRGRGAETRYAKQVTPRIVELLENYFGSAYPYDKLDSVMIPQTVGFGAMENVGMITYEERLYLAKPHGESDKFKLDYASVAAHEIAHQWFGDLVTMQWWDDVWLNEAFATWLGDNKITYQFNPAWDDGWGRAYQRQRAVASDRLASTRRIRNPVNSKDDIDAAFDSITYQKGGSVLEMFEASMTPERFRDGVRLYMQNHANGSATMEDFVGALSRAAGDKNLLADFSSFIEQPGVPLIDASLECNGGVPVLLLQQARLKPVGSTMQASERWNTPACFTFAENGKLQNQCVKVPNGPSRVPLNHLANCPDWLMGNADGVGYYVMRYDNGLRQRLQQHALSLPARETVAMLSDAVLLNESGLLPLEAALALVEKHIQHADVVVVQTAAELLKSIRVEWLSPPQQQSYTQLVQNQLLPLAQRLTWGDQAGDTPGLRRLRSVALPLAAERSEAPALRAEAAALTRQWLQQPDSVSANMANIILKTAAQFADAALVGEMEQALPKIAANDDRRRLLEALANVREPPLRERALGLALNEKVNGREALNFLQEGLEQDANRAAAFGFVQKNFDALVAKVPAQQAAHFIQGLERMCSSGERDEFVRFFKPRLGQLESSQLPYTQALEKIELCVAARSANENNFKRAARQ